MKKCVAMYQAHIKCSKRNQSEIEKEKGREREERGREGAGERSRKRNGGRERVRFQTVSGTILAKLSATLNARRVSTTHQGTAAIF